MGVWPSFYEALLKEDKTVYFEYTSGPWRFAPKDGHPFYTMGTMTKYCKYGSSERVQEDTSRIQSSTKIGCTAKLIVRSIWKVTTKKFPSYERGLSDKVKESLKKGEPLGLRREFWVVLPTEHSVNHLIGEDYGRVEKIDDRVTTKIKDMYNQGVRRLPEMERHIGEFVSNTIFPGGDDSWKRRRRYWPSRRDIYNIMYNFGKQSRFSDNEQLELSHLVREYREQDLGTFVYNMKGTPAEADPEAEEVAEVPDFFLGQQNVFQRHLLSRYGNTITLLDTTYKTTKFVAPLAVLSVPTNYGYSMVATFVIERETTATFEKCLRTVKEWCPEWNPEFFMVDFAQAEISAIEAVFPECKVLLCDVHRVRAWTRWLDNRKNDLRDKKDEVLALLRNIAGARTEEDFNESLEELRASDVYNAQLEVYMERTWLPCKERWVKLYRDRGVMNKVNTTNGIESIHRAFKRNFLANRKDGSLKALLQSIVKDFLPHQEQGYRRNNLVSSEAHRTYRSDVPAFARNRPASFTKYIMKKLPSRVMRDSVEFVQDTTFSVHGSAGDRIYIVDLSVPSCQCPDWDREKLPCKHMVAVILHENVGWDSLDESYTSNPFINLDTDYGVHEPQEETQDNQPGQPSMDEATSITVESLRAVLQEMVAQSYIVDNENVINEAYKDLRSISNRIQMSLKTSGGIPTLRQRRRRRKGKPKKRVIHETEDVSDTDPQQQEQPAGVSFGSFLQEGANSDSSDASYYMERGSSSTLSYTVEQPTSDSSEHSTYRQSTAGTSNAPVQSTPSTSNTARKFQAGPAVQGPSSVINRKASDLVDAFRKSRRDAAAYRESIKLARQALSKKAAYYGCRIRREVAADGNCMFTALEDQIARLSLGNQSAEDLRKDLVQEMADIPFNHEGDHLSNYVAGDFKQYLDNMARDGTYGDHLVLQKAADILGREINIVSTGNDLVTTLHPVEKRGDEILLLGHIAEMHYESLETIYTLRSRKNKRKFPFDESIWSPEGKATKAKKDKRETHNENEQKTDEQQFQGLQAGNLK